MAVVRVDGVGAVYMASVLYENTRECKVEVRGRRARRRAYKGAGRRRRRRQGEAVTARGGE